MDSKRIVGGLVALGGAALGGEWIVRGADLIIPFFYHEGMLEWGAIRNLFGFVALFVGGYFLLRPSNVEEIDRKRGILVTRIGDLRKEFESNDLSSCPHLYGEMVSVYEGIRSLKIAVPDIRRRRDRPRVFLECYTYLTNIFPLIRDGHLAVARQEAPGMIEALEDGRLPPTNPMQQAIAAA